MYEDSFVLTYSRYDEQSDVIGLLHMMWDKGIEVVLQTYKGCIESFLETRDGVFVGVDTIQDYLETLVRSSITQ